MTNKALPKEWKELIGKKPAKARNVPSKNIDWIFEMLGWKRHARRAN